MALDDREARAHIAVGPHAGFNLFIAAWPDAAVRERFAGWGEAVRAADIRGRFVAPADLHLTLAFLGHLQPEPARVVEQLVQTFRAAAVPLVFDRLGHWPRNRILWGGCQQVPAALGDLVAAVREALETVGLPPEPRRYLPHISLARHVRRHPRFSPEAIPWTIDKLVLAGAGGSSRDSRYQWFAQSLPFAPARPAAAEGEE